MRKKTIFSLSILVFWLILLSFPLDTSTEFSGTATINIIPNTQVVQQNTEFEINIRVYPEGEVAGIQCDFQFNSSIVEVINVTPGNFFDGHAFYFNNGTIDNINGSVRGIAGTILGEGSVSTPGTFAVITMKSLFNEGKSYLNLSNVIVADPNANPFSLTINNGSVDVIIERTEIKIVPSTQTVKRGDFLEINVSIEPIEEIWGIQFDIIFDPSELTANNVYYGGLFGGNGMFIPGEINNTAGIIDDIACFYVGPGASSSPGNIAIINFSVGLTAEGSMIYISDVLLFNATGGLIPPTLYKIQNGSFSIEIEKTVVEVLPSSKGVHQKEAFTINISVTPGTEIAGVQVDVSFNPLLIQVINVTKGDLFGVDSFFNYTKIDNANGTIIGIICVKTSPGGTLTPGTLATITFQSLIEEGTSSVNLSNVIVGDAKGKAVPVTTYNGTVNVEINYTKLYIEPANQTVSQQKEFIINVSVVPGETIAGIQFDVIFNPSLIEVENISYGGLFGPQNITGMFFVGEINNTVGIIRDCVGIYLGEGGINHSGNIATITFISKMKSGTSSILLSNVRAGDPAGEEAPTKILNGTINVIYEHVFHLKKGWNLITIPVQNNFTAETLGQAIGDVCDTIVKWDAVNKTYVPHPVGTPLNNFEIIDGMGYLIHLTNDTTFIVSGYPIKNISIEIEPGWNLIGWIYINDTNAEFLGNSIMGCDTVLIWNTTMQDYIAHPVGTPIHNFNISIGTGILLHATQESIWYGI